MKNRILSILLVFTMLTTSSSVAFALNNFDNHEKKALTKNEITQITKDVKNLNLNKNPSEENYSTTEIEQMAVGVEGLNCQNVKEESIAIKEAVTEFFNNQTINSLSVEKKQITKAENQEYITEIYHEDDIIYARTFSNDKTKMTLLTIDDQNISSVTYLYDSVTKNYEKQSVDFEYKKENSQESTSYAQGVTYNSKTSSAEWKDTTFWYRTGQGTKTDSGKTYLKIGCKETYEIRTDNLSQAKEKKCTNYMTYVKASNSHFVKGVAYLTGTGFSTGFIIGLIIGNATFPPSVIVTTVVGIVGGGATIYNAVENFVDSYTKWLDAKDYYNVIKTYGIRA